MNAALLLLGWLACSPLALSAYGFLMAGIGGPTLRDLRVERAEVTPNPPSMAAASGAPSYLVIAVHLTTGRDLSIYGRLYQSSVNERVGLCTDGQPDPDRRLASVGLRTPEGRYIGAGEAESPETPHQPDAEGRYPYLLVLPLTTQRSREPDGFSRVIGRSVAHDYRRDADDICFTISGAPMIGTPYRSDPFTIPYPLISAALARAGLPHAPPAPPTDRP